MPNVQTILSTEDILSFIRKGIEDAKGSLDAIQLLTQADCIKLGEELANREALIKTPFFSVMVNPINDIEEGKTTVTTIQSMTGLPLIRCHLKKQRVQSEFILFQ